MKKMKNLKILVSVFAIIISMSYQTMAQDMTAREIIEKVYNRPEGDDQRREDGIRAEGDGLWQIEKCGFLCGYLEHI